MNRWIIILENYPTNSCFKSIVLMNISLWGSEWSYWFGNMNIGDDKHRQLYFSGQSRLFWKSRRMKSACMSPTVDMAINPQYRGPFISVRHGYNMIRKILCNLVVIVLQIVRQKKVEYMIIWKNYNFILRHEWFMDVLYRHSWMNTTRVRVYHFIACLHLFGSSSCPK